MKAAIITWVTYNNYGTALQAFALKKAVEQYSESCSVISDRPIIESKKEKNGAAIQKNKESEQKETHETGIKHVLGLYHRYILHPGAICSRLAAKHNNRLAGKRRTAYMSSIKAIEKFKTDALKVYPIETADQYASLNKQFDVFICGSDQIWSMLPINYNPYFYMDFVEKKKIAYAPSTGSYHIEEKDKALLCELLRDFSAVSLREKVCAEQFENLLGRKVHWVLDPTLLHNGDFWNIIAKKPAIKKKYLLCYFLENKDWYFSYAHSLAKHLGLKVVLIPSRKQYADRKETYCEKVGPEEFVGLFSNASFVLTDSYHGTIFSLQFNKQFLYLKRFSDSEAFNQNVRVDSLLSALDLYDKVVVDNKEFAAEDLYTIHYGTVDAVLNEMRDESLNYLKNALEIK